MEFIFGEIAYWLNDKYSDDTLDVEALAGASSSDAPQMVATKALDYLRKVQAQVQRTAEHPDDLIAISLQDMKYVSVLTKITVFCGISSNLDFSLPAKWKVEHMHNKQFLAEVLETLYGLMAAKDDLSDVISMTQFQPWVLAGAAEVHSLEKFSALLSTFQLYQTYMILLSYPDTPEPLKVVFSSKLSKLPFERSDAVRAMIELFSGYRQSETIQVERVEPLVEIFGHPPQGTDFKLYVKTIDDQLFAILGNTRTPLDICVATCHLIDLLDSRTPQILKYLRDSLLEPFKAPQDKRLESALMTITNLLERGRAINLVLNVASEILPVIWLIFVQLCETNAPNGSVLKLLVGLVKLRPEYIDLLLKSLSLASSGDLQPVVTTGSALEGPKVELVHYVRGGDNIDFGIFDTRVDMLVTIISKLDDAQVTNIFVKLLRSCLALSSTEDSMRILVNQKLLQVMVEDFKPRLFSHPQELVDMCLSIIGIAEQQLEGPEKLEPLSYDDADSDDEDDKDHDHLEPEFVEICVDLLTGILLECLDDTKITAIVLSRRDVLQKLLQTPHESLSVKVLYCLKVCDTIKEGGTLDLGDDNIDYNDPKQVYNAAQEALKDSLVPIRAQGLQLLRQLLQRKDSPVDVKTVVDLTVVQLRDDDSYLYLNAIKTIEQCSATFGPNAVLPILTNLYASPNTNTDLDILLRVGEAIVRIVEASAKAFTPHNTVELVDVLLAKVRVQNDEDNRLRMSSMSILGWLTAQNALGLHQQQANILDCCLGILRMEKDPMMLRSALVVLLEALNHANEGTLELSRSNIDEIKTQLNICADSGDEMVSNYARDILAIM